MYGLVLSRIPPAGEIVINGLAAGSPAQRAGLQPGDVVAAVDGVATPKISDANLSKRLKDTSRLTLRLQIRRLGERAPLEITVDAR